MKMNTCRKVTSRLFIVSFFFCMSTWSSFAEDKIKIKDQIFSFDTAMPMISNLLASNADDQSVALNGLIDFGDTITNKDILEKVCQIAASSNNFSHTDVFLMLPEEKQKELRGKKRNNEEENEKVIFRIKLLSLCVLANSGNEEGRKIISKYAKSKSVTERYMASSINEIITKEWESGRMNSKAKKPDWFISKDKIKQ